MRPDQPGRYSLVWDVQRADGTWASVSPASKGDDLLQAIITVTGKGRHRVPVDLSKDYNGSASDFDGQGHGLPDAMLPPDGTAEVVTARTRWRWRTRSAASPARRSTPTATMPATPTTPSRSCTRTPVGPTTWSSAGARRSACRAAITRRSICSPRRAAGRSTRRSASAAAARPSASPPGRTPRWTPRPGLHSPYHDRQGRRRHHARHPRRLRPETGPVAARGQMTLPNAPAVKIVAITLEK